MMHQWIICTSAWSDPKTLTAETHIVNTHALAWSMLMYARRQNALTLHTVQTCLSRSKPQQGKGFCSTWLNDLIMKWGKHPVVYTNSIHSMLLNRRDIWSKLMQCGLSAPGLKNWIENCKETCTLCHMHAKSHWYTQLHSLEGEQ